MIKKSCDPSCAGSSFLSLSLCSDHMGQGLLSLKFLCSPGQEAVAIGRIVGWPRHLPCKWTHHCARHSRAFRLSLLVYVAWSSACLVPGPDLEAPNSAQVISLRGANAGTSFRQRRAKRAANAQSGLWPATLDIGYSFQFGSVRRRSSILAPRS
jgi:hypothetical protein